ncbi:enoyl-CoA hydratase family protein [Streptomyces sp. 3N207]|uniref:enoyl-CoA hydratase family protein n=1 Tax=Streptomyces sp. 3N207 TaxID=3457417 RepID=UPI003FD157BB
MATPEKVLGTGTADGIRTLTLDSPHNRNALSARLVGELCAELERAENDDSVRAVLLTHTGNTFCAGADLSEAESPLLRLGSLRLGVPPARRAWGSRVGKRSPHAEQALAFAQLLRRIVALPKPVVARVTGHVRAGGTGLLAACDISVAGPEATFAFTEARIGVAPAVVSMPVLPRTDPRAMARYYLTGERFGPQEAARIGLVTLAADDPDEALAPVLDGLRRGSPQGLAESKRLVTREVLAAFDRDTGTLAELSARLFASDEAREGMTAFLERREPEWAVRQ